MTRSKSNRGPFGAPAEEEAPVVAAEVAAAPESPTGEVLVVVEGKSLITTRGVRGPGQDVTADELAGGAGQLKALKDNGFLEVK